jgi:DNA processing protein
VRPLTPTDAAYPRRLLDLAEPPETLYLREPGDGARLAALLARPVVSIVGTRRASEAGAAFARRLARTLATAGVTVVSGLARGIDAAAHVGALEGGGPTVAVLGCGVDRDYPRANAALAARIVATGCVVAEYPPGTPPAPWRFPARNRIVAALGDAVCVVEAARRSGALITAHDALELGREVLAAPAAPWHELGAGSNGLLRDGAGVLADAADVLVALGLDPGAAQAGEELAISDPARRVLAAVRRAPATAEVLAVRVGVPAAGVGAALAELELAGLVVRERDGSLAPA